MAFLSPFVPSPFDDRPAGIYGRVRSRLELAGTPLGPMDYQIAAIALVNDLVLATHIVREFSRVEGLRLDDWALDYARQATMRGTSSTPRRYVLPVRSDNAHL